MRETVLVLGSGPIRIGQGIEFDYSCVHCVWALESMGYRAAIINNNPETVSTDFDISDGLYFEPVTLEDVLDVVAHEHPIGVAVQFGGQTAINLAPKLEAAGVKVLGTSPASIAAAEDRGLFERLLSKLAIPKPPGRAVRSVEEARMVVEEIGYPVLVRPSYVLGGRAMEIVYDEDQLLDFYAEAEAANPDQPVLVDKYLMGIEAEVDVISDGEDTLIPGIMEHIERAGVHSGDSMAVYPPIHLSPGVQSQVVLSACRIARELQIKGLMNIQFVIAPRDTGQPEAATEAVKGKRQSKRSMPGSSVSGAPGAEGVAYVLEVNPRGSRTIPYISKVTGIPMVELATRCMMGNRLRDLGFESGLWALSPDGGGLDAKRPPDERPGAGSWALPVQGRIIPESDFAGESVAIPKPLLYAVKAPVFSFQKLTAVEPQLGPEMKSTGEILGVDKTFEGALYKALVAAGITFKGEGCVLLTVQDQDKPDAVRIAEELARTGRRIAATRGTHEALRAAGIDCLRVHKISEGRPSLFDLILGGQVSMLINTPGPDPASEQEAARIRRACIEMGIACITNIDTASALIRALDVFADPSMAGCMRLEEYFSTAE